MVLEFFNSFFVFVQKNFLFVSICASFVFLFFGSFLNVFLYRGNLKEKNNNFLMIDDYLKEHEIKTSQQFDDEISKIKNEKFNLSFPSSHCPQCKNKLKWWHNIPLLSYILLKGKCFFCKEGISKQYPIVEALTAIVLTSGWYFLFKQFNSPVFFIYMLALIISWMIILFDYKYFIIPDYLNYSLLWTGLLASATSLNIINASSSIIGAVVGFMILFIIAKIGKLVKGQDAMGDGDLKLLAGLGALTGAMSTFFIVGISSFVGIFTYIIFKYIHKNKNTEEENMVPYGPSLIIAFWIFLFFKSNIINLIG